MQQTRRVRTVRLQAPDEGLVRRGALLLEDALRVASLPQVGMGRVLIIRSLAIGQIAPNLPSASLALTIEQRVTQLSVRAVHAANPGAARAEAVYFRDEIEPFVLLATRLGRHEDVSAWFWQPAVRVWRREAPRDEALRSLLLAVTATPLGAAAIPLLLHELHHQAALDPLLGALRPQDGDTLLDICKWTAPSVEWSAGDTPRAISLELSWRATIARWAVRWGRDDTRTLWLAASALGADKPARLGDPRLPVLARAAVQTILTEEGTSAVPAGTRLAHTMRAEPKDRAPDRPVATPQADSRSNAGPAPTRPDVPEQTHDDHPTAPPEAPTSPHPQAVPSRQIPPTLDEHAGAERPPVTPADSPDEPLLQSPGIERHQDEAASRETAGTPQNPDRPDETVAPDAGPWRPSLQPTAFAGLHFLIPAMTRLGMPGMLDSYPHLYEIDLPDRVLRSIARRLGVPRDDPILGMLAPETEDVEQSLHEFVFPSNWGPDLCREGECRARRLSPSLPGWVLYDASGRLPLALWHGPAPDRVPELTGAASVRLEPDSMRQPDVEVLVGAWVVGLRRWCRRFAEIGLRDLVQRPGRVHFTRTHLDVVFKPSAIDLRIRRSGLDLDPGWLPWLGRVVTFHYQFGDDLHGID